MQVPKITLVVGATGATGKHVVLQLLQQQQSVRAIVRSKQRLLASLDEIVPNSSSKYTDHLEITEASLLDLTDDELQKATGGCDAVVSCLGHNGTFKGIFGHPKRLVTDAVRRLTDAIEVNALNSDTTDISESKKGDKDNCKANKTKFILMGSEAVSNPAGGDDKRGFGARIVLFLLRYLIPPHRDNELAAEYIFKKTESPHFEWTVIRPTNLIDGLVSKYQLFPKPHGPLFGSMEVTRANVAKCMVDMVLSNDLWDEWKFKMPALHNLN